jgi:hypothetical protein
MKYVLAFVSSILIFLLWITWQGNRTAAALNARALQPIPRSKSTPSVSVGGSQVELRADEWLFKSYDLKKGFEFTHNGKDILARCYGVDPHGTVERLREDSAVNAVCAGAVLPLLDKAITLRRNSVGPFLFFKSDTDGWFIFEILEAR